MTSDIIEQVYVALGSNLGDRERYLSLGRMGLAGLPQTELVAESSIEETIPIGPPNQGPYLNQMVSLKTKLTPEELLRCCQSIERKAGRVRTERWAARTLDLDIVKFGNHAVSDVDLIIPHPEYVNRPFWQRGIAEIERHDA